MYLIKLINMLTNVTLRCFSSIQSWFCIFSFYLFTTCRSVLGILLAYVSKKNVFYRQVTFIYIYILYYTIYIGYREMGF